MNKIRYIMADKTDGALPFIYDRLKEQKAINDRVAASIVLTVVSMLILNKIVREQNEKIEELSNEVKELKQMRGE